MQHWIEQLYDILIGDKANAVLVTIVDVKGSAPREAGARIIVTENKIFGTIGGGNLEFTATEQARSMLLDPDSVPLCTRQFALGPGLRQCCGGRVKLSYEKISGSDDGWINEARSLYQAKESGFLITCFGEKKIKKLISANSGELSDGLLPGLSRAVARILEGEESFLSVEPKASGSELDAYTLEQIKDDRQELWLFGAGHVGRAIVGVMQDLPYRIKWVDSRPEAFVEPLPSNVSKIVSNQPQFETAAAGAGAWFLVLTHSHKLDEDICHGVLKREDFGFLGLIGSETKKARFLNRLRDRGVPATQLARMVCPIGIDSIEGRKPREIAISVAAQLLSLESIVDAQQDSGITGNVVSATTVS